MDIHHLTSTALLGSSLRHQHYQLSFNPTTLGMIRWDGVFLQHNPTCFPGKKKSGSADGDEMGHLAKTNQTAELPLQGTITYGLVPWRLFFLPSQWYWYLLGLWTWYLKKESTKKTWRVTTTFLGCLALHLQPGRQQVWHNLVKLGHEFRPKMSDYLIIFWGRILLDYTDHEFFFCEFSSESLWQIQGSCHPFSPNPWLTEGWIWSKGDPKWWTKNVFLVPSWRCTVSGSLDWTPLNPLIAQRKLLSRHQNYWFQMIKDYNYTITIHPTVATETVEEESCIMWWLSWNVYDA